jgi:AcrR family transcriptional regulator
MQGRAVESVDPYRVRLLEGFAAAVGEKGYAAVTIADIVRHARVSKRTFYEHFPDKERCFLATYVAATGIVLGAVKASFDANASAHWRDQLDGAIDAYVTALEANPALTRACLVDIHAAGPRALERRREVHGAFADMLCRFVARTRKKHREVRPITREMATAVVGGINELLLVQVERGPQHRLSTLRETASDLMHAVLTADPRRRRPASGRPADPRRTR